MFVKAHSDLKQAIKNYKAIRDAVGEKTFLIMDANQSWKNPEAVIDAFRKVHDTNLGLEQPVLFLT